MPSNDGESVIEIPKDLSICESSDPMYDLNDFIYMSLLKNFKIHGYFQEREILASTNEVV